MNTGKYLVFHPREWNAFVRWWQSGFSIQLTTYLLILLDL